MNSLLTDRRLNGPGWRRRYHAAFTSLLHFKLTVQALGLPDDPAPEQLSEVDLDQFLLRLLADLQRFVARETRFLEASPTTPRGWRIGELLPLLDLFDETSGLDFSVLPPGAKAQWRSVARALVRLKSRVVHLHIFG